MVSIHSSHRTAAHRRGGSDLEPWLVVGAGRCGLQLARAMAAAAVPLSGVVETDAAARTRARRCLPGVPVLGQSAALPASPGVLVAVPDQAVGTCASWLAGRVGPAARVVVHTSGALPASVLAPLRGAGRQVASLHPLMAFARGDGAPVSLAGVAAAVEGEPRAVGAARRLARRIGLAPFALAAADKPLYHALAAVASNLTLILVAQACDGMSRLGPTRAWVCRALAPLVHEATRNALATGDLSRLTGPLVRGDVTTVGSHLAVLPAGLAAAYASVARLAVERLARDRMLTPETAVGLDGALTNPRLCDSVAVVRRGEEG